MNRVLIYLNSSVLTGVWTNAYLSYKNLNNQQELKEILLNKTTNDL